MEFCFGGTLQRKLETSTNISWELRWKWSFEMSKGLYYLHQQGVLHRDLKAENILLDIYGTAKLADLGVAQVDSLLEESEAQVVSDGLQDKRFIAPENLQNSTSTKMTDIYALGFVFCWALNPENRLKLESIIEYLSGMEFHQQSALIKAIQKLEELLHTKCLEGVSYIAPYLTNSQDKESID